VAAAAVTLIPVALQAFETLEPIAQAAILDLFKKVHHKQLTAADAIAQATAIVNAQPPAKP
jgi:hypothetical protein